MNAQPPGAKASRHVSIRWLGWAAVVGLLGAALAAPLPASGEVPGNNGTVKIHEGGTETEPIVRNEPHVCTFHLHFFFADPVDAGTWEIQEWSPGDMGTVVLEGTYNTNIDGEDRDPDEPGVYELPDGHYKLFWDGDLDTEKHDKHKVFWVDCAPETGSPPPSFEQSQAGETESVPPSFEQSQAGETESVPPSFEQSQAGESTPPSFGQSLGGVTEVPGGNVTQPPTDTLPTAAPNQGGQRWLLVVMAALLAMILVLTPSPQAVRRR